MVSTCPCASSSRRLFLPSPPSLWLSRACSWDGLVGDRDPGLLSMPDHAGTGVPEFRSPTERLVVSPSARKPSIIPCFVVSIVDFCLHSFCLFLFSFLHLVVGSFVTHVSLVRLCSQIPYAALLSHSLSVCLCLHACVSVLTSPPLHGMSAGTSS